MARTKSGCRRTYVPRFAGSWHSVGFGPRISRPYKLEVCALCKSTGSVIVPSLAAFGFVQTENVVHKNARTGTSSIDDGPIVEAQDYLTKLPNEILLQIMRPLLLTGQVFHITPSSPYQKARRVVSVHRMTHINIHEATTEWNEKRSPLIIMSLLCRRLTDIVYTIWYGENQFVFEISSRSLVSHVPRREQSVNAASWNSWNKILRTQPGPLVPLSSNTARYLTSLTLSVAMGHKYLQMSEWRTAINTMEHIGHTFNGDQPHELKALHIDFGLAKLESSHRRCSVTNRLCIVTTDSIVRIEVDLDSDSIPTPPQERALAAVAAKSEQLLHPLRCIKGLREVYVTGAIDEKVAADFKAVLLGSSKRTHVDDEDGGSSKRQRMN